MPRLLSLAVLAAALALASAPVAESEASAQRAAKLERQRPARVDRARTRTPTQRARAKARTLRRGGGEAPEGTNLQSLRSRLGRTGDGARGESPAREGRGRKALRRVGDAARGTGRALRGAARFTRERVTRRGRLERVQRELGTALAVARSADGRVERTRKEIGRTRARIATLEGRRDPASRRELGALRDQLETLQGDLGAASTERTRARRSFARLRLRETRMRVDAGELPSARDLELLGRHLGEATSGRKPSLRTRREVGDFLRITTRLRDSGRPLEAAELLLSADATRLGRVEALRVRWAQRKLIGSAVLMMDRHGRQQNELGVEQARAALGRMAESGRIGLLQGFRVRGAAKRDARRRTRLAAAMIGDARSAVSVASGRLRRVPKAERDQARAQLMMEAAELYVRAEAVAADLGEMPRSYHKAVRRLERDMSPAYLEAARQALGQSMSEGEGGGFAPQSAAP